MANVEQRKGCLSKVALGSCSEQLIEVGRVVSLSPSNEGATHQKHNGFGWFVDVMERVRVTPISAEGVKYSVPQKGTDLLARHIFFV